MTYVSLNGSKEFYDLKQALDELAFCHYPVTVSSAEESRLFDSFDSAREYVESLFGKSTTL